MPKISGMDLDLLKLPPKTLKKLKKAGFTTAESIAFMPEYFLAERIGISKEKILEIREKVLRNAKPQVVTALKYLRERRSKVRYLTTGCRCLDDLLGGGVETGAVTEFVGEFGTGKTQIAHQLSVTVQLSSEEGGLEAKAVYIDTEGTFRPERIMQIAEYRGLNPQQTLENILYARTYTSEQQIFAVKALRKLLERERVGLIVVDSVVAHFRSEYVGDEVFVRQRLLAKHLRDLITLAEEYNVAVVVTNHVLTVPETFIGNPLKPVGGNVLAHGCAHRVWLRRIDEKRWAARLFDSPSNPEAEVVYTISREGVIDY